MHFSYFVNLILDYIDVDKFKFSSIKWMEVLLYAISIEQATTTVGALFVHFKDNSNTCIPVKIPAIIKILIAINK